MDIKNQSILPQHIEGKIFTALERLSEAFRVLVLQQAKTINTSPIQYKILLFISLHKREYCHPSYLADEFNVTKATLSDSIKALEHKGWIYKATNPQDFRSYTLELTDSGKELIKASTSLYNPLISRIEHMDDQRKTVLYESLLSIITDLNSADVISLERNCFKCKFYKGDRSSNHYCQLLEKKLKQTDLRLDCPEHQALV